MISSLQSTYHCTSNDVFLGGLGAALLSPLMMVIGFIIWDKHWKGSAFALNLFKCSLASVLLLVVVTASSQLNLYSLFLSRNGLLLMASAVIGIVIGDYMWLLSLQILGARRVIVVDSLKPFIAAILGHFTLDEEITALSICGMFITILGVVIVSLEKENDSIGLDSQEHRSDCVNTATSSIACELTSDEVELVERKLSPERSQWSARHSIANTISYKGYSWALINVLLDCFGSVLTKMAGVEYTTWQINLNRFGTAGIIMSVVAISAQLTYVLKSYFKIESIPLSSLDKEIPDDEELCEDTCNTRFSYISSMSRLDWLQVATGVVFVTFLCPVLAVYALLRMDVALCLTLTSIGPIYSIPLVYIMKKEIISPRGALGGLMACFGVAFLSLSKMF